MQGRWWCWKLRMTTELNKPYCFGTAFMPPMPRDTLGASLATLPHTIHLCHTLHAS